MALTLAVVAVLAGVGGAAWYVSKSSSAQPVVVSSTPAETRSVESSPTPTYDAATLKACHYAEPGVNKPALAIKTAGRSGVPALRSIAKEYGPDPSLSAADAGIQRYLGSAKIGTWCNGHHINRGGG